MVGALRCIGRSTDVAFTKITKNLPKYGSNISNVHNGNQPQSITMPVIWQLCPPPRCQSRWFQASWPWQSGAASQACSRQWWTAESAVSLFSGEGRSVSFNGHSWWFKRNIFYKWRFQCFQWENQDGYAMIPLAFHPDFMCKWSNGDDPWNQHGWEILKMENFRWNFRQAMLDCRGYIGYASHIITSPPRGHTCSVLCGAFFLHSVIL